MEMLKMCDAKAELNRRGQACAVLAGTGVRAAKCESKIKRLENSLPRRYRPAWFEQTRCNNLNWRPLI